MEVTTVRSDAVKTDGNRKDNAEALRTLRDAE